MRISGQRARSSATRSRPLPSPSRMSTTAWLGVLPAAQIHQFRAERGLERAEIILPERELWILHPSGEPLPTDVPASKVQVMLLDGTWIQAGTMMKALDGWGRRGSLPMTGDSRYWLRAQAASFSLQD